MWLKRLPPEFRRRYYTNLATIGGFLAFFVFVGRLGKRDGTMAILGLFAFLLAFMCMWPLVRLIQDKSRPRNAVILYAAWILAFIYFGAGLFVRGLPGSPVALLLGLAFMWAFFIMYRRVVFPSLFDGGFGDRWRMVREAQRAERAALERTIRSITDRDA